MRRILNNIFLSGISLLLSVFVTVVVYRLLWRDSGFGVFAAWVAVFELAQFFLLADIGFTHKYIREYARVNGGDNFALARLRGTMLIVGGLGALGLLLISIFFVQEDSIGWAPVVLLSLATAASLFSYADTAELRVRDKFPAVYVIQIISQLTFAVLALSGLWGSAVDAVALAVVARSLLQVGAQILLLRKQYSVSFSFEGRIDWSVLQFNGAYFLLFMLDGVAMLWLGIPSAMVAVSLLIRKYFDVARSLGDAAMQVFSVHFAKEGAEIRWVVMGVVGLGALSIMFLFGAFGGVIDHWVGGGVHVSMWFLGVLAVSSFSVSLFRWFSSIQYFAGLGEMASFTWIAVAAKILFCLVLIVGKEQVEFAYALQATMVLGGLGIWAGLHRGKSLHVAK